MRNRHVFGVLGVLALACASLVAAAAPGGAQEGGYQEEFNSDGTYWVPHNTCRVEIQAFGGSGGPRIPSPFTPGGDGGGIGATFAVHPGEPLTVIVGQQGASTDGDGGSGTHAGGYGYNYGGSGEGSGGGGGGSSAVLDDGDLLIVAGGGGGARIDQNLPTKIGGDGGQGENNGSSGTGQSAGAGGSVGGPSDGEDAIPGGEGVSNGGGGAGAGGGDAGQVVEPDSPYPGGAGGGGASNAFDDWGSAYAPGSGYPSGSDGTDGYVLIKPGYPGEGCPESTLQVKKVVGDNSTGEDFVVRVDCSHDWNDNWNDEWNDDWNNDWNGADVHLPFNSDGSPDGSNPPNSSWDVVDGTWLHTFTNIHGVRCTATETDQGDATLVEYTCDWDPGDWDDWNGGGPMAELQFDNVGCPGSSSGPSEDPDEGGTVVLDGWNDSALLTVYNDFDEPIIPDTPDTPIPDATVTPPPVAAPAAIVAVARFTG